MDQDAKDKFVEYLKSECENLKLLQHNIKFKRNELNNLLAIIQESFIRTATLLNELTGEDFYLKYATENGVD